MPIIPQLEDSSNILLFQYSYAMMPSKSKWIPGLMTKCIQWTDNDNDLIKGFHESALFTPSQKDYLSEFQREEIEGPGPNWDPKTTKPSLQHLKTPRKVYANPHVILLHHGAWRQWNCLLPTPMSRWRTKLTTRNMAHRVLQMKWVFSYDALCIM